MDTPENNLPNANTNEGIQFPPSDQPILGNGVNETAVTTEDKTNASSPLSVEEKPLDGRVGFYGLASTDKTPTFNGANSKLQNALHNDIEPFRELVKETPAHRRMIELATQGFTNIEIARLCEVTTVTVVNVLRQPWARERMIKDLKNDTLKDIRNFLETEALPSLEMIKAQRDSALSKPSEKIAASTALLDRFMGKPNQPVTTEVTISKPEELSDNELAALIPRGRSSN